MKVIKYNNAPARRVMIGMIVHDQVLGRIAGKWTKEGLFKSDWENELGKLCVDHYKNYDKAPGKNITAIFESWADEEQDKEKVKDMDRFLTGLSNQYATLKKDINPDLITDLAAKHFNKVELERFKDLLEGDLERGDVEKALLRFDKRQRIELSQGDWIDVLQDEAAWERAFSKERDRIIKFKGPLGNFFGDAMERDGFIGIMAPEKRGKSFVLQELGATALLQGRKVAMFQVGDLSEAQAMMRLGARLARHPTKRNRQGEWKIRVPKSLEVKDYVPAIEHDVREFKGGLSLKGARDACARVINRVKTRDSLLRLSVHPNTSISAAGIGDYLLRWDRDGWSPDVLIIDYADILAPMNGTADTRDQINMTWKYLRRLSQERHCLVITATQANAASYESEKIRRKNFSEDKRKYAHTTGMFAINQIDSEKRQGIMRFNWLVLREDEFSEEECVYVAGCLGIANPMMLSAYNHVSEEEPQGEESER